MRRFAVIALLSVAAMSAVSACSSAGAAVPSFASPEEMSRKASSALGVSSCGKVDEAATYSGAHYVICDTRFGKVQFVAAESESAAKGATDAMNAIGWMAEQSGAWAVGANDQAALDAVKAALSA